MTSLSEFGDRTNTKLGELFHTPSQLGIDASASDRVWQAMAYSTLGGGKRIRAKLSYASALAVGAQFNKVDYVAMAIECIHAYSLIHDDLPAMDDDDLRRGKPTCHKEFDEATAVLAGDGLQSLAFALISNPSNELSDKQSRAISFELAKSAGHSGMVGGQMLDMQATNIDLTLSKSNKQALDALETIHKNKTGALIQASVVCGALCNDSADQTHLNALTVYAQAIGLAFQVVDDILDIESTTKELGKTKGADQTSGKLTYPALIGLDESKQFANNLYQQAIESIHAIGDNTRLLSDIASLIIKRTS